MGHHRRHSRQEQHFAEPGFAETVKAFINLLSVFSKYTGSRRQKVAVNNPIPTRRNSENLHQNIPAYAFLSGNVNLKDKDKKVIFDHNGVISSDSLHEEGSDTINIGKGIYEIEYNIISNSPNSFSLFFNDEEVEDSKSSSSDKNHSKILFKADKGGVLSLKNTGEPSQADSNAAVSLILNKIH